MLVAKWFSQNVLGTSGRDLVKGPYTWFLDCLLFNQFTKGWCVYRTIMETLYGYSKKNQTPPPFPTTMIMEREYHIVKNFDVDIFMKEY